MTKTQDYRQILKGIKQWDSYLLSESGLPGPRGNLELAQAVADEGNEELFQRYLAFDPQRAPVGSPDEFLAFCGVVGMGRLLAEGRRDLFELLRHHANDPRWRLREAVAMALQRLGDVDMQALLGEMEKWSEGSLLEKRAAAAAVCEPRLLRREDNARWVLRMLDGITASLATTKEAGTEDFRALKKGLGYCWSVAVAALPAEGKKLMEKWLTTGSKDVVWIMKENLAKNRLVRIDREWVGAWRARLAGAPRGD